VVFTGPDSLTPSERRAAQMAAEGMTNREIAETLFVTLKTVEKHLGNCYLKLDIRGRSELSRALEQDQAPARIEAARGAWLQSAAVWHSAIESASACGTHAEPATG
jgi:DNA-binding CsgD family transcriptional regulator